MRVGGVGYIGVPGGDDHFLYHSENGRMKGLVHVGNMLIDPVDAEGILDKIVCPDTEEIHVLGQYIGHGDRRRNLDHDTHLNVRGIFNFFSIQFIFYLTHDLFCIEKLL